MQYLLSEEEYGKLVSRGAKAQDDIKHTLEDLCQKVCDHMPMVWTWGEGKINPKPWGCFKTVEVNGGEWYCDDCPVKEICPESFKQWSK